MAIQIKSNPNPPRRCPQCASRDSFLSSTEGGNPVWKCSVHECGYTLPRTVSRVRPAASTAPTTPQTEIAQLSEHKANSRRIVYLIYGLAAAIIAVIGVMVFTCASSGDLLFFQWQYRVSIIMLPVVAGFSCVILLWMINEGADDAQERAAFIGSAVVIIASVIGYIFIVIKQVENLMDPGWLQWVCLVILPVIGMIALMNLTWRVCEIISFTWEYAVSLLSLLAIIGCIYGYMVGGIGPVFSAQLNALSTVSVTSPAVTSPAVTSPVDNSKLKRFDHGENYFYAESDNLEDGYVEYHWSNGNWYKGTFIKSDGTYIDGVGQFKIGDVIYEGQFINGSLYGAGKLYTKDESLIYDGDFDNGYFNGTGTYSFPEGIFTYDGWVNGGTEILNLGDNGTSFATGKWQNNNFYGCVYENENWYSIEIIDGVKSYAGDYGWMLN